MGLKGRLLVFYVGRKFLMKLLQLYLEMSMIVAFTAALGCGCYSGKGLVGSPILYTSSDLR
jgi:hypothetical protein